MSEQLDELISLLAEAPNNEIDGKITKKIEKLVGKTSEEVAEALKEILNECAKYSLASELAMMAMDVTLGVVKKMAEDNAMEIHMPN